jgi:hypothetical protein
MLALLTSEVSSRKNMGVQTAPAVGVRSGTMVNCVSLCSCAGVIVSRRLVVRSSTEVEGLVC